MFTVIRTEAFATWLDGLKDRDELEELAKLFEESSQAWTQISEPERKILLARAAALMAERKA